jgi:TorA maturation chaperone TorD
LTASELTRRLQGNDKNQSRFFGSLEGAADEDGRNGMLAGRSERSQPSQPEVEATELAAASSRAGALPATADFGGLDPAEALAEVDAARAREYALLAALLTRTPDQQLLDQIASLGVDASSIGVAHAALAEAAQAAKLQAVEREYFELFIGIGRGELMPYGSYYLTGFLYERPLARLRGDLAELGIARAERNCEPEDHIGTLCEVMAGLASGRFPAPAGSDEQMFKKHIEPWAGRFFADLERAQAAGFYRSVGTLGRVFIDVETEAFALPA